MLAQCRLCCVGRGRQYWVHSLYASDKSADRLERHHPRTVDTSSVLTIISTARNQLSAPGIGPYSGQLYHGAGDMMKYCRKWSDKDYRGTLNRVFESLRSMYYIIKINKLIYETYNISSPQNSTSSSIELFLVSDENVSTSQRNIDVQKKQLYK